MLQTGKMLHPSPFKANEQHANKKQIDFQYYPSIAGKRVSGYDTKSCAVLSHPNISQEKKFFNYRQTSAPQNKFCNPVCFIVILQCINIKKWKPTNK
jgi:hypothetical protein